MKWSLELDLGKQAHMHDSTLLSKVLLNMQTFSVKEVTTSTRLLTYILFLKLLQRTVLKILKRAFRNTIP